MLLDSNLEELGSATQREIWDDLKLNKDAILGEWEGTNPSRHSIAVNIDTDCEDNTLVHNNGRSQIKMLPIASRCIVNCAYQCMSVW